MPRNMSFMLTPEQVRNETKTVTRRLGWRTLKIGEPVHAVKKGMGLKKGQKVERLKVIVPVSKRRERLDRMLRDANYGTAEVIKEGFPELTPAEFVKMFCESHGCKASTVVTRIEFLYDVGCGKGIEE